MKAVRRQQRGRTVPRPRLLLRRRSCYGTTKQSMESTSIVLATSATTTTTNPTKRSAPVWMAAGPIHRPYKTVSVTPLLDNMKAAPILNYDAYGGAHSSVLFGDTFPLRTYRWTYRNRRLRLPLSTPLLSNGCVSSASPRSRGLSS